MDKKKVRLYIILLVLLLCGVLLLPFGINYVTDATVGAILKHSQVESESETESEMEFETESETIEPSIDDKGETTCEETDLCETYNDSQKGTEKETPESEESIADTTSSGINSSRPRSSTVSSDQGSSEPRSEEEEEEQVRQYADMENYAASFSPELIVYEDAKDCYADFMAGGEENFLHALGEYFYSLYGTSVTIDKIELLEPIYNNDDECSIQTRASALEESETFITRYDKGFDYYGVYAS